MAMEGPWELAVSEPENKYLFNGIEHESDFGLDWDMADFRSYDPTIGRWLQVDPLMEISHNWTPYRFGFDNPILYGDYDGLFETKKAAEEYAKANGIKTGFFRKNKIVKESDGTYSIENKKARTSTSDLGGDFGVMTSTIVKPNDVVSDNSSLFTIDIIHRSGVDELGMPDKARARPSPGLPMAGAASGIAQLGSSLPKMKALKNITLDFSGKFHGVLPQIKNLRFYSKSQLQTLVKTLKESVKKRIKLNIKLGPKGNHGKRQGQEQDLIKSVEKLIDSMK